MSARDRAFVLRTAIASVIAPGLLLLARPFDETRAVMGILAGWGAALLVMVPSYWLLARAMASDGKDFLGAFLGGSLGRLVATAVIVLLFVRLVPDAPQWSFVASYFLGYMVLTVIEMSLTVARRPNGSAA